MLVSKISYPLLNTSFACIILLLASFVLVNLANYWTNKNKKVVIYGEFDNITINKIDYINWKLFPYQDYFNILILFNIHGLMSMIPFPIKANQIYWDVYDNFINNVKLVEFFHF